MGAVSLGRRSSASLESEEGRTGQGRGKVRLHLGRAWLSEWVQASEGVGELDEGTSE